MLLSSLLLVSPAYAAEAIVLTINLPQLAQEGKLHSGIIIAGKQGAASVVRYENPDATAKTLPILTVEAPKISTRYYCLKGEVRTQDVNGTGYLEMWNHFGPQEAYFSRTLGDTGLMKKLEGTADWRAFVLPFNAEGTKTEVTKLVLNLQLSGKGIVDLRSLRLTEAGSFAEVLGDGHTVWWAPQTGGWIGGLGGALLGVCSGVMEWLASRGRARGFVLTATRVWIGVGVLSALVAIAALLLQQPFFVWYGPLLVGGLCLFHFPLRLRRFHAVFRDVEMRKMESLDAGSSSLAV